MVSAVRFRGAVWKAPTHAAALANILDHYGESEELLAEMEKRCEFGHVFEPRLEFRPLGRAADKAYKEWLLG